MVALVDRDDDGHLGCLGVGQGLEGLGHDTVVGCNHKNDNVGHVGTASTHRQKGSVTGSIQEGEALQFARVGMGILDRVGADVLGDATGFT